MLVKLIIVVSSSHVCVLWFTVAICWGILCQVVRPSSSMNCTESCSNPCFSYSSALASRRHCIVGGNATVTAQCWTDLSIEQLASLFDSEITGLLYCLIPMRLSVTLSTLDCYTTTLKPSSMAYELLQMACQFCPPLAIVRLLPNAVYFS